MTQDTHPVPHLKQHTIWQDGQRPEPCIIIILGATGDLTQRKLLPTLAHLAEAHPLPHGFLIVAFARRPLDDEKWRAMVIDSLNKYAPEDQKLDEKAQRDFAERT